MAAHQVQGEKVPVPVGALAVVQDHPVEGAREEPDLHVEGAADVLQGGELDEGLAAKVGNLDADVGQVAWEKEFGGFSIQLINVGLEDFQFS